jgi:molybdenum cofactor guanylyltransferase
MDGTLAVFPFLPHGGVGWQGKNPVISLLLRPLFFMLGIHGATCLITGTLTLKAALISCVTPNPPLLPEGGSMAIPCTGVILAGGQNKRYHGRNKAFIQIGGQRIIDRILSVYTRLFNQIVLVTNDPLAYLDVDALIVSDHYPDRSSLNGMHAGLFAATNEFAFFTACDTPFVNHRLIAYILDQIDTSADLIIPYTQNGFEPMFAVYRKTCLPAMTAQLEHNLLKIQGIFRKVRVKTIAEAQLREIDPQLTSFFNVNTPEDLQHAEALYRSGEIKETP